MKKLALLLTCFTVTILLRAQDNNFNRSPVTLQSPDATQFIRYGDIPVDYSTGVPNISIPIYKVSCGKLSLPIDISYSASGVKVLDIAGTAGLGWSLNAGGLVSRTILGADDQQNKAKPYLSSSEFDSLRSLCSDSITFSCVQTLIETFNDAFSLQNETQSDRYFYSFNGRSGIFRPDFQSGAIKTIPYSALKISAGVNNAGPYRITAEDGTIYYFEQPELSGSYPGYNYYTSYYLTKIQSPDLTHAINIYYKEDDLVGQFIKSYQLAHVIEAPGTLNENVRTEGQDNEFVSQSVPVMPDSITSDNETILFQYIADRPDLRKSRLYRIKILNRLTRDTIKVVEFQHSYFGTEEANNQRLRLDSLYIKDNSGATVQQYGFGYNSTVLPPYYHSLGMSEHHNVDYWGYYNAADDANLLPEELFDLAYFTSGEKAAYGGNRNPNPSTAQACILTQITYPTGGKTNFEYELNKVPNGYSYITTYDPLGDDFGGLRVKKITSTADAASPPVIKTYKYAGWFHTIIEPELFISNTTSINWGPQLTQGMFVEKSTIYTDPFQSMTTGSGPPAIYDAVIEYDGTEESNNGYIEYQYDNSSIPYYIYDPGTYGNPRANGSYLIDFGNYKPQLTAKVFFGRDQNNDSKEIKREEYTYNNFNSGSYVTGIKLTRNIPFIKTGDYTTFTDCDAACYGNPCQSWLASMLGYCESVNTTAVLDVPLLVQKKETVYPSTGTGELVTTTDYTYDLVTVQPIKEQVINSKGETITTILKYPFDFSASQPYTEMVNRNVISPVIEKIDTNTSRNKELNRVKTNYAFWTTDSIILPSTIQQSVAGNSLSTEIVFNGYDHKGNIRQYTAKNGLTHSYIWNYGSAYPVAEVAGADSSSIAYTSFEADGKGNWAYSGAVSTDSLSPTGKKYYTLPGGNITKSGLASGTTYTVSYWKKDGSGTATVNSGSGTSVDGRNGWTLFMHEITGTTSVTMAGSGAIDELRLCPKASFMTSYTYEPLTGMTSQCDANNRITYYEYDNFNRLSLVRDQDYHILKKICYNYAGEAEDCGVVFYNVQKTGNFTRDNCGSGYAGSTVTYTVAANTYSSTISQACVDSVAQADVNANGQAYANTHGTCQSTDVSVYAENNHGAGITIQLHNVASGQDYWINVGSHDNMSGDVPPGSYNITITPGSSGWYSYSVGCSYWSDGPGAITFYGVSISSGCNSILID